MKETLTQTRSESLFETWTGSLEADQEAPTVFPRIRLLYHVDLSRIGSLSHPEFALQSGEWQTVGRKAPKFVAPRPDTLWRPLEDPTISRAQLRVRWHEDTGEFEIEPIEDARRGLFLIRPDAVDEASERVRITRAMRVEPGSCVAVDDRLLLGLETLRRYHDVDEDRLGFIGDSDAMWRLRDDITEVGMFYKPVLILGPTGAGKELVAAAIHSQSQSADGAFKTVNCAALPEHLVESLLFGHRKGAFTGADASQEGMFMAANGGTLFLDELGEMPVLVQPKLLRTLQDGLVTPVGALNSVKIDVRLVAATNRDPEVEIAEGRLRADLYHRMSSYVVHVPSLAARRFDVPGLFLFFLERLRHDFEALDWFWRDRRRWRATIPMGFFLSLMNREWEGNVRQLENIADRTARRNIRGAPFQPPTLPRRTGAASASASALAAPASSPLRASAQSRPDVGPHSPAETTVFEHLHDISQLLNIASKTLAKLFDHEALALIWGASREAGEDEDARRERFHDEATQRLYRLLTRHDFKQSRVTRDLGVSAWTLIRMMQIFGIPRPSELTTEQIIEAIAASDQDIEAAAARLKVSVHGLKKRCTTLGIST